MTHDQAFDELQKLLGRKPRGYETCTGDADSCPIEECMLCGIRDCPSGEPLHYHHDGCPWCDTNQE
jgi:hypothetical protein